MIFVPSNYEDISRYFRGTYVKFKEHGNLLFYIQDLSPREIRGTTDDGQEFRFYMNEDYPYEVEYVLPKKSYFQYGKYAALLQRIPAKQYRRGVCKDNTNISYLTAEGRQNIAEVGFAALKAYVNKPVFPSLEEALSNKEKAVSYALSSRMAFCCKNKCIYIDDIAVAEVVVKEGKYIKMIRPIYKDEVQELARNTVFEGAIK